ncbi:MAG: Asp-tRNA(Asn)/Glu-tRNA(Gln) amidotransferase subunit GatA [Candidatus Rokuibacteriota bacterium]|nr:MAG: Asp-tRNA(Asn)/Glu-tRNA(Gln) amidotransferase subunit GatA [Candidatus Rokubacteria bacterium]
MSDPRLPLETIASLAPRLRKKEISPVELTDAILDRIASVEGKVKAYVTVMRDEARAAAKAAEASIVAGNYLGPLHGIPVAVKDLYYTRGVKTTAGSKILANFVPDYDAAVVERLKRAGAIIVGKANTHEFAMNTWTPPTRNPWDLERIPGGSSGGSGAALAASECIAATGTDTGGSIRIPASFCGVVGLKPTFGRVSRHGVVPLAWTADHAGPMTKTVEDAALLLKVMAGHDPRDPATVDVPVPDYPHALAGDIKGLRVGMPTSYFFEGLDKEVDETVRKAVKALEGLGASVEDVSLPHIASIPIVHACIVLTEAATYHEKWLRTRADDYAPDVRFPLEWGKLFMGIDYVQAQRVRELIRQDFATVLSKVDLIVAPTVPIAASKVGEDPVAVGTAKELVISATIRLNRPSNHTGLPAISVPCGFTAGGLPIGLQLIGRALDEVTVLRAAHAYEAASPWRLKRASI